MLHSNSTDADPHRDALPPGGEPDLPLLAASRPGEAMVQARAILAGKPGPTAACVAHQVVGTLLREFGDLDAAIRELRVALRLARVAGSQEQQADVRATLGVALIHRGQAAQGLAELGSSLALVTGRSAGRLLVRRGIALWVLGRHLEALDDLRRAVRLLRPAADNVWEARALTARALVHLAHGSTRRAEVDLEKAELLFSTTRQELEVAYTWHNRGLVAFRSGDLPLALAHLDEADRRYRQLAAPTPDLSIHRCAVLLAAGLSRDALQEADSAIRSFPVKDGQATKGAELLLIAARAALAAEQPQTAIARAEQARRMFGGQGRTWWQAHAELLVLQARFAAGVASRALLARAATAADGLDRLGSDDAPHARLLAGRVALALRQRAEADRHLAAAARTRHRRAAAMARAHGWLAEALRADAAGSPRRLLNACRNGFAVLDEHRLTFGASELRAQATAQGAELAALAQRHALRSGRPRLLLAWSERWRSTAQAVPPARSVDDDAALHADLTALREITSRLHEARAEGDPAVVLQREQLRLESAVRARVLRTRGARGGRGYSFDIPQFLAALGEARLVQILDLGGDLHLLVCGSGRVRHVAAGSAEEAAAEVDYARFSLGRLAHGRDGGRPGDCMAILEACARKLETVLLGDAVRLLPDGWVTIVPPASLHAVPWPLLPSLRERAVSVAPSARSWLHARAAVPPPRTDPVLILGPGLGAGGGEVPALAAEYPGARMLGSGTATVRNVLGALDGASLAHISAHGTFRSDSPLFSSLRMDDGPLTVHDLERLRRAPYRLVLSSCDSGVLATAGADELLGLTSTLAPLGTAGIVASVVPVNDKATAGLMLALHRHLRRGSTLAEALRDARGEAGSEPVETATALSFVALGAA
jgi:tetratricopeptide (TPR) repeat protein